MSLSKEEKALLQEALAVYIQILSQQMPRQQVQQVAVIAEGILKKLDTLGQNSGKKGNKSEGITDEWYKNVCLACDKLSPNGCTDKVTEKFPGKCDPILHYENNKLRAKK
jgi:hypothetical protein